MPETEPTARPPSFLDLLYSEAPREAFDVVVADAERSGATAEELSRLRDQRTLALRVREQMTRLRQQEAEISALYETANDLIAIRDVDAILAAIARRARQLLNADMTYLSLNDESDGASYMKVTDGSVSAEFRNLRLPLGTGLLGLVAQTGAPYYTDDYQSDSRFLHRDYIDHAVGDENIRAILGVPLIVEGKVIGALLATHRTVRPFPPGEVTLLSSFAAHAAIALENARLFEETQAALAEVDAANQQIRAHSEDVEVAARAHDRLTDVLLQGGGVEAVGAVLGDVLEGALTMYDGVGRVLTSAGTTEMPAVDLQGPIAQARRSGRSVEVTSDEGPKIYVAAALAGSEHLGTLVLHGRSRSLGLADRRTLERGALVTALVLLFSRSVAEAEDRVRGELLTDLLSGRETDPTRLRERARRERTDLDQLSVVAVASAADVERHRGAQVAARLGGEFSGLGGHHEGQVVVVATGTDPLEVGRQLRDRLIATGGSATVGVGFGPAGPGQIAATYTEARQCLSTLLTLGRDGEVSDAAGLGLARLVLGKSGPDELQAFIRSAIGPVLDYDELRGTELVPTLEAWFEAGSRSADTARRLHIHPNTVGQRLDRIGKLLGAGWREPSQALDLQMALRLWRLRG